MRLLALRWPKPFDDLQAQLGRLLAGSLRLGMGGLLLLFIGVALVVSRTGRVAVVMVG